MSSVRMCDRCGTVFSERSDDWSTFTGTRSKRNQETGRVESLSETMDSCPECTELMMAPPQRPELTSARPQYETKPGE